MTLLPLLLLLLLFLDSELVTCMSRMETVQIQDADVVFETNNDKRRDDPWTQETRK